MSWVPLALLFVIFGRAPKLATLWVPMFIVIELVFAAGVAMAVSSIIIQMRDLMQVLPIITSLGLFATPVIWPFSEIPTSYHIAGGHLVHVTHVVNGHLVDHVHRVGGITVNLQMVYGFFNPLGPIIANARNTMLLGQAPEWDLVAVAVAGATTYLLLGLPHLQEAGGELCRHCLTGPSPWRRCGRSSAPTRRYPSSTTS